MPTRLCLTAGCSAPISYRGYCKAHARARETKRVGKAIYNTARWQNTRKRVLSEHPLCKCGEIATDVHHREDLADGGDPWDLEGLEALCHSCHSTETRNRMDKR